MPITSLTSTSRVDPQSDIPTSTTTSPSSSPLLQQLSAVHHNPDGELPGRHQPDNKSARCGNDFRNLRTVTDGEGIYFFDDTYKGAPRLNIMGHSIDAPPRGEKMHFVIDGIDDAVDGADLRYLYDRNFGAETLNAFAYIRVISCYAAEGDNPLGQQIANAFKLETKAFSNRIISLLPEVIEERKINSAFICKDASDMDYIRELDKAGISFVAKADHPKFEEAWPGYFPTKFQPK